MASHGPLSFSRLLRTLVLCSEKAASIARLIKTQYDLFDTLVQRKTGAEANPRFNVDVKTLADVLIQEVVRHDLNETFPGFGVSVFGEENNHFSNIFGESIYIHIPKSMDEMAAVLARVLNHASLSQTLAKAALRPLDSYMSEAAFKQIQPDLDEVTSRLQDDCTWSGFQSHCGVWIDPIDATAEYARGHVVSTCKTDTDIGTSETPTSASTGSPTSSPDHTYLIQKFPGSLINVTVLIGLFDRTSGVPLVGVINQPFYPTVIHPTFVRSSEETHNVPGPNPYCGRICWGFCLDDRIHNAGRIASVSRNFTRLPQHLNWPPSSPTKFCFPDRYVDFCCNLREAGQSRNVLKVACSVVEFDKLKQTFKNWAAAKHSTQKVALLASPGAGLKLLLLALGEVDAYLLTGPNTYFWDTCAAHAILRAQGGGILHLRNALEATHRILLDVPTMDANQLDQSMATLLLNHEIDYSTGEAAHSELDFPHYRNSGGLLAYRDRKLAIKLLFHLDRFLPQSYSSV
ncbi:unnamed protein product [Calicophoron daubneyi]|uniref:Inositol polyphosphate 1-phosphatase n=1 Tax=Calicophoron daubneyi TaxID=300641 RepID=A0AAV2TNC3_CALDB